MSLLHHEPPVGGLRGLAQNWRNDVLAALSVSMVALPLSLGISLASGVPASAGLFAALIGGLVTTFVRGSHISINGPGNGLIAVILLAMSSLDSGVGPKQTFQFVLAAIVIAGLLQVLIGLLKLGKLGEIFPSSVIHGILAAIGIIILGKQVHVALGVTTKAKTTLDILLDIPNSVMILNPQVALISGVSLLLLVLHPKMKSKMMKLIPAPMWVLLAAIPLAALFKFSDGHSYKFWGQLYQIGPKYLVQIPDSLFAGILSPDFSRIGDLAFWNVVISITLISSIETMISAKAVDKLDPFKRTTDPNRELIGVGLSSVLSGMIGGLPIVTVIARSSVNIHNYAKTRWSNFFHSVFLLLFVVLFAPLIQQVPLAALAAILVHTGYRLTSPKTFKDAQRRGWEQLTFLLVTLGATLLTNLVWGLVIGTIFTFVFHNIRVGLSPAHFFKAVWKPIISISQSDNQRQIAIAGVSNFGNILQLRQALEEASSAKEEEVKLDFSRAQLVDHSVLEYVFDHAEKNQQGGRTFQIEGLQQHQRSTSYPQALHVLSDPSLVTFISEAPLSRRQIELKQLAETHGWTYKSEIDWDASYLKNFQFFEIRPLEFKENVISGSYEETGTCWEISDLTFDEGSLLVEEFHTTTQVIFAPFKLPCFVVERIELFDRLMELVGNEDIDYKFFTTFSKRFVVKGPSAEAIKQFFTPELVQFFESHDIYHLESNGEALLVFRQFRLLRPKGILAMHDFSRELLEELRNEATAGINPLLRIPTPTASPQTPSTELITPAEPQQLPKRKPKPLVETQDFNGPTDSESTDEAEKTKESQEAKKDEKAEKTEEAEEKK